MKRELNVNHLSRVEGHGAVDIVIDGSALKEIRLRFTEGPRFFEYITRERLYTEIPKIVSRICGICYVSHRLASSMAIEDAFGVEVTEEIKLLRKLLIVGEYLESHALHLYFLALPDYMGYGSAIEMAKDYPNIVKRGFAIKEVGNRIMKTIAGKTVHGENVLAGGFKSIPEKEQLERIRDDLYGIIPELKATLSLFDSLNYPEANSPHNYELSLKGGHFGSLCEELEISDGTVFTKREYEFFVEEEVSPYSTAKRSTIKGKAFLIGPLARVNRALDSYHPSVKEEIKKLKNALPSSNPFLSNLARAVELLEAGFLGIETVERLLNAYPFEPEVPLEPKKGEGYGVKEAPRGTLYHRYAFDENGRCIGANIITPTAQLQAVIEENLASLVEKDLHLPDSELKKRAEMLVRAYDP